jgi:hypothetical protein
MLGEISPGVEMVVSVRVGCDFSILASDLFAQSVDIDAKLALRIDAHCISPCAETISPLHLSKVGTIHEGLLAKGAYCSRDNCAALS